jgi:uncharacterized cupredoxin-like copper-binding protein
MRYLKQYVVSLVAGLVLAFSATTASAGTEVSVELWNKGVTIAMPADLAYGMPAPDLSKVNMGIKLSRVSVPAGEVTFKVTNASRDSIHEMIVMHLQEPTKPLPYIDNEKRVDEGKSGDMGEVSELGPGKSGALSVVLVPGKYLLICNMPGHYAAGMWTEFEVTK